MRLALEQRGIKLSRSTVIRAMRKGNLLHKQSRGALMVYQSRQKGAKT
ncbi:hypothetical protein [Treponema parvum]